MISARPSAPAWAPSSLRWWKLGSGAIHCGPGGTAGGAGRQDPETEAAAVAVSAQMQPPAPVPLQLGARRTVRSAKSGRAQLPAASPRQQYLSSARKADSVFLQGSQGQKTKRGGKRMGEGVPRGRARKRLEQGCSSKARATLGRKHQG